MRILFDHNAPAPLRHSIRGFKVETAAEIGWERLTNGDLLDAAEREGFDILLTSDKGFLYQQNRADRRIAIVILDRGNWPDVKLAISSVLGAVRAAKRGTCTLVEFP